jgi:hypothetical protein
MDHEVRMFLVALKLGSGSTVNGAKLRTVWDVFRPTLGLEDSGFQPIVLVLVLVIDSLDSLDSLDWGGFVPGTSCQATIAPSLRDISQQAIA